MTVYLGTFPSTRLRRMRSSPWIRRLNQETQLHVDNLIQPIFICEGQESIPIESMPGIQRYCLNHLEAYATTIAEANIPAVSLFPCIPEEQKSADASLAFQTNNLVGQAIRLLKDKIPSLGVIADVALDPYTTHGHDGLFINGDVDNDLTLEALAKQALALASAGVDVISPSEMMDGRVGYIRQALDTAGYQSVLILAHSAKYASSFYSPFRKALGSMQALGGKDKRTYHMPSCNAREALREIAQDLSEGADMVMIKPALPYLDIIRRAYEEFSAPVFAYQVSGEYAMIQAAHGQGWINGPAVMMESLLAIKRAGASGILTYGALDIAPLLKAY